MDEGFPGEGVRGSRGLGGEIRNGPANRGACPTKAHMGRHFLHALRLWRRTLVVSVTIVLTLAIAIGANTVALSVLRAVLLTPIGVR
ncbi:hypothetical protein SBA4_1610012 [Candidatus Sulfopaludibacter sp. SbA4]|nr:hypothetical protein SBA4_1610012 [Candidatus Sulfopaludibacter sp. SbA4]